jgi:hypothetical protein
MKQVNKQLNTTHSIREERHVSPVRQSKHSNADALSAVSSRNSLGQRSMGMSNGSIGAGSMKIGGLARRKHAKQNAQLRAEIKAMNYVDP